MTRPRSQQGALEMLAYRRVEHQEGNYTDPERLTPREVEILTLVARRLSNKDISACLVVAPKTVAHHIEHIYAKLGIGSRAAATLFATQHGLVGVHESELP